MHFPSNSIPLPIPKGNQYLECWVYVPFTFQIVSVINIYISRFWSVCPMLNCSVVSDSLRLHGLSTVAHQAPLSMGVLQARMLEWVAMPSSRGSSLFRDWTQVSRIAGGGFSFFLSFLFFVFFFFYHLSYQGSPCAFYLMPKSESKTQWFHSYFGLTLSDIGLPPSPEVWCL